MIKHVLTILLFCQIANGFQVTQENFTLKTLDPSWVIVEKANFTATTFTMHIRVIKTIRQYNVQIRGYQRISGQMKPTPFNWNIDYCRLAENPLKYNLVIGSFYLTMADGNNLGRKCPIPAGYFYQIDDFGFSADYFPKFFPPGHFKFNITLLSGKVKIINLIWIWNVSHMS